MAADLDFSGKAALVTGSGNGINYAERGAKVIVDRDGSAAAATVGIVRQQGGDPRRPGSWHRTHLYPA
jgi:hypothetical protein